MKIANFMQEKSDGFIEKCIVIRKMRFKKVRHCLTFLNMVSSYPSDTVRRITLYRFLQDEPSETIPSVVLFLFASLPCLASKACI